MRPPGMLILSEIAIWLDKPTTNHCREVRYLLERMDIAPAIRGTGRAPSQWRFADLEPLKHLAAGARLVDELDAA